MWPFYGLSVLLNVPQVLAETAPLKFELSGQSPLDLDNANPKTLPVETLAKTVLSSEPVSRNELVDDVTQDFLGPLPGQLDISTYEPNITGQVYWSHTWPAGGDVVQLDIMVPLMSNCRPSVYGPVQLAEGLHCGRDDRSRCRYIRTFTITETYTNTIGFSIGVTAEVSAGHGPVSASVSTSFESRWEHEWSRSDSTSNHYEFELDRGERCIPSMAHVDLECDVVADPVYYDTWWHRNSMHLEWRHMRTGGPYANGQWCREYRVREAPLRIEGNWQAVRQGDPYRGMMWKLPASQMNQHRINSGDPRIRDDQTVIRRVSGHGGDFQEIFVCDRNTAARQRSRMKVPLSSPRGALLGYIGCVLQR